MSDCLLFASLFATYAVLANTVAGGPSGKDIFELPYVLGETLLLLFSSHHLRLRHAGRRTGDKRSRCWAGWP